MNKLDSIYTIQDLVDGKIITTHITNLYMTILEHRGDCQRRTFMELKVRWRGYGPEYDSWEPYKNLACSEQLILYLVRHRMKSLIEVTDSIDT